MREVKTIVYKFDELSETAQQKAIEKLADINVDYEWWEYTYDDATNVGIKITGFDIDRGSCCEGDIYDFEETAKKILENHGEKCETYQTAANFLKDRAELVKKYSDGINTDIVSEDNEYDFDSELDELEIEFKKSILEDYRILLQKEYDYLTSKEAIIDTITANEYEFSVDGKMV